MTKKLRRPLTWQKRGAARFRRLLGGSVRSSRSLPSPPTDAKFFVRWKASHRRRIFFRLRGLGSLSEFFSRRLAGYEAIFRTSSCDLEGYEASRRKQQRAPGPARVARILRASEWRCLPMRGSSPLQGAAPRVDAVSGCGDGRQCTPGQGPQRKRLPTHWREPSQAPLDESGALIVGFCSAWL